ncbi:MAG: hypothetical protein RLY71_1590 [Pseudomonadota bacterium]|jgi:hypothetical protein
MGMLWQGSLHGLRLVPFHTDGNVSIIFPPVFRGGSCVAMLFQANKKANLMVRLSFHGGADRT